MNTKTKDDNEQILMWREEFEIRMLKASCPIEGESNNQLNCGYEYFVKSIHARWLGYFWACKARQLEIDKRDELLREGLEFYDNPSAPEFRVWIKEAQALLDGGENV